MGNSSSNILQNLNTFSRFTQPRDLEVQLCPENQESRPQTESQTTPMMSRLQDSATSSSGNHQTENETTAMSMANNGNNSIHDQMASGIQENTEQPQTAQMIRNISSPTNLQNMNNNLEMGNSRNSLASDNTPNSTDIESQIPSAREADINRRKKFLINFSGTMTCSCFAAALGMIGFNATMANQQHHKELLWIVALLLSCDFVIFLFIWILLNKRTSWLAILETLVYLALGILVIAVFTGVMSVK